MKNLGKREIAQLKRTAQNVAPLVIKKNKIQEKISQLYVEYDLIKAQIDAWETATKAMTGGYTTEDLVDRVIENNVTKYVLKYPDTVVPVTEDDIKNSIHLEGATNITDIVNLDENEEPLLIDTTDNTF